MESAHGEISETSTQKKDDKNTQNKFIFNMPNANTEEIKQILIHLQKQKMETLDKRNSLKLERSEFSLVLEALEEISSDRRCYRSLGGVLIEHTVQEVRPALRQNIKWVNDMSSELDQKLDNLIAEQKHWNEQLKLKTLEA